LEWVVPADKARITVDLPPELRRQLKAVAAALHKTMREVVTESVRRELPTLQRQVEQQQATSGKAAQPAAVEPSAAQSDLGTLAAGNEAQLQAAQQLTEPLLQQMALAAEQVAETVRASQRQAVESALAQLRQQLAALAQSGELRVAADRVAEQHRAALEEALDRPQQTYLDQLRQLQEAQLVAVRRHLDPFARDWESAADSLYDDFE
jgi:hypothetical protein